MTRSHGHDFPEELDGVVERLRSQRASLTPLELDQIKLESRARAAGRPRIHVKREERMVMRTRAGILAVLVSGIVLSSAGAALGISGLASDSTASKAQYPGATVPITSTAPSTQVPPTQTPSLGGGAVKGAETNGSAPKAAAPAAGVAPAVAQPTRQESLERGGTLPFTGYAAIPVLLLGLALLGAGVVMRHRSLRGHES